MADNFLGVEVSITLKDGAVLQGTVGDINQGMQILTLQGNVSRNGKKLKLRELELEASEIVDIDLVPVRLHTNDGNTPQDTHAYSPATARPVRTIPPPLHAPPQPQSVYLPPPPTIPAPYRHSSDVRPSMHTSPNVAPTFPGPARIFHGDGYLPPLSPAAMVTAIPYPHVSPIPMLPGHFPYGPTVPHLSYYGTSHTSHTSQSSTLPRSYVSAPVLDDKRCLSQSSYMADNSEPSTPITPIPSRTNCLRSDLGDTQRPKPSSLPRRTKKTFKKNKPKSESLIEPIDGVIRDDFDFEGNLNKFDKARVFAEIEQSSDLKPEALLVSHNKKVNYAHYENILEADDLSQNPVYKYGRRKTSLGSQHFRTEFSIVVPHVTTQDMDTIYATAESIGISRVQLIENAAHSVCCMALKLLGGSRRINPRNTHQTPLVVVLAGSGFKGASAIGIARHLASHNVEVRLCVVETSEQWSDSVANQLRLYSYTDGKLIESPSALSKTVRDPIDLVIDGLNITKLPTDMEANLIKWATDSTANVLSLDVPSGIDATTGSYYNKNCRMIPKWTITYGLPKTGLQDESMVGALHLADIGIPGK
eukprot:Ihof_evm1s382 gene=Ihof_evmTU1s382